MKITLLTIAAVMFAATQASAASVSLVLQNGSFETPDDPSTFTLIPPTTTEGNWTALGATATITDDFGTAVAPDLDQFIQISHLNNGRIFQFLGTTDAASTDITLAASFATRNLNYNPNETYTFGLYSDAAGLFPLEELTGQSTGAAHSVFSTNSVTATGVPINTDVYAFFKADTQVAAGSNVLMFVDAATISVTEIPEPSSILLLGLGLVGMIGFGARKRK